VIESPACITGAKECRAVFCLSSRSGGGSRIEFDVTKGLDDDATVFEDCDAAGCICN